MFVRNPWVMIVGNDIWEIRDTSVVLQLLRRFMSDPLNMMALRIALADGNASANISRLSDHEVLKQLAWRIVSGQTSIVSRVEVAHSTGPPAGTAEPAAAEPAREAAERKLVVEKLSWIEIEMVDDLGTPVAGERYEIVLPNGAIRRASLGSNGRVRISEIDPGTCKILFPDLDAEAWGPV